MNVFVVHLAYTSSKKCKFHINHVNQNVKFPIYNSSRILTFFLSSKLRKCCSAAPTLFGFLLWLFRWDFGCCCFFLLFTLFWTLVFSALNFCMHVSALTLKFFLSLWRLYLFFYLFIVVSARYCCFLLRFIQNSHTHSTVFLLLYYVAEEEAIFAKQQAIIIKTIKRR